MADHRELTELHTNRWTSAEACAAAGIAPATLKNWVSRRPAIVILNQYDEAGTGRGSPNSYSLNRIMQLAIMRDLVELGWQPRHAALAAIRFTDMGDGESAWEGDGYVLDNRMLGQLYSAGDTILLARPPATEDAQPFARVVNIAPGEPWGEMRAKMQLEHGAPAGVTLLRLNDIMLRVRLALGLPAFA